MVWYEIRSCKYHSTTGTTGIPVLGSIKSVPIFNLFAFVPNSAVSISRFICASSSSSDFVCFCKSTQCWDNWLYSVWASCNSFEFGTNFFIERSHIFLYCVSKRSFCINCFFASANINFSFNGSGRLQTTTINPFVGMPLNSKSISSVIILEGTFLEVSASISRAACFLDNSSSGLYPMIIPDCPISPISCLSTTSQTCSMWKAVVNSSAVLCDLSLAKVRNFIGTLGFSFNGLSGNSISAIAKSSMNPIFIGKLAFWRLIRFACAFASCILVSTSCISNLFAANSLAETLPCSTRFDLFNPSISLFEARNENPNAISSAASPQTTISQKTRTHRLLTRTLGRMSLGRSENLWCSAQTSPQHPTPTITMLTNSSNSHIQSNSGDVSDENVEAIMRSNYIAAVCSFAGAFFLICLGIFSRRRK